MTTLNQGDTFEDNEGNTLEINEEQVEVRYSMPLETFERKFLTPEEPIPAGENPPLVKRLLDLDVEFDALQEHSGFESQIVDVDVTRFDSVEPFDLRRKINLNALAIGFALEDIKYEPESQRPKNR